MAVLAGAVIILIEVGVGLGGVLVNLDERDGEQEDGHGDESGDEEPHLDEGLQGRDANLEFIDAGARGAEKVHEGTGCDVGAARDGASGSERRVVAVAGGQIFAGRVSVAPEALDGVERGRDVVGGRHEHVDEEGQERRRWLADAAVRGGEAGLHRARPVGRPLVEDGEDQIAEDALEEDDLRYKLEDDLFVVLVLDVVEERKEDAERHLQHADDDGDLHLEGVEEGDLVVRHVPNGVDAHGVDVAGQFAALARLARLTSELAMLKALPARSAEPAHRISKGLVVQQADEGAEEAVQEAYVPAAVDHLEHVAKVLALPLLFLRDEVVAKAGEQQAMAKVTKHDAE
mmetsp:Transcript_12821/g.41903  ORF Transcript_12821/g.41903 Transcript_12821/m.41903 type:complete len:345 (-) Transcript_12821:1269-2303(-)|eukprot:scaffold27600_cov124-Isochrysis_galbana.AAC.5